MIDWLASADDVLRARGEWGSAPIDRRRLARLVFLLLVFGLFYGLVMGCYDGGHRARLTQALYSALKVPLLLAATFALSLPSFFILNTLLGLRDDFRYTMRAMLATQAGLTIVLASLAPLTAVWYASSTSYDMAKLFNAMMFGVASIAAQFLLRRHYAPLIRKRPAHRWMMYSWLVIYSFVGVQMAWVLRPFLGAPGMPTQFFRDNSWSNAYVHISDVIWRVLSGG